MRARANISKWVVISLILVITCKGAFADKVIYVDDDAAGANDGSSWADAYKYLQDALADANSADTPVEIRVAQGIYRPDRNASEPNGTGDRKATFQLISGVTLRGGYAGFGERDPYARDIEAYETILSGDLAGNDVDVNDPCDLLNEPTRLENSFHVVTGSGTDGTSVLDAFSITGGNARTHRNDCGSGVYNNSGYPRITNCKFISNSAEEDGGGMYNDSKPTLINCTFSENAAGTLGGGIVNNGGVPSVKDCTFYRNSAGLAGGAMVNSRSSPILNNCTFNGNWAESGGALQNIFCSALLTNCRFICNRATYQGGGMDNQYYSGPIVRNCMFIGNLAEKGAGIWNILSLPTLANCTFVANSADRGNAVGCGPAVHRERSKVKLSNCILWDGGDEIWSNNGSTITVSYSNVQGGRMAIYDPCDGLIWGEGNIDAEPLFADPDNGDYHLKSQAGRWVRESQSWVQDDATGPCIDAGDMGSPIGFEPFPNGGVINMGAYGGTAEASKSYFGEPVCETIIAGDINGDCKVDFEDLGLMALHWLEGASPVNSNRTVMDGIEYYMQTDKCVYHLGENVKMLFRVTNLRNEAVSICCSVFPEFNFLIQKDGEAVWMWIHGWYTSISDIDIAAGGSEVVSYDWDMKDDDSNQVEPGEYKAVGVLYNQPWNDYNQGVYTPTEIAVRISIIP